MNVMTLSEEEALTLGVDTRRVRLFVIAAATLMTAAVVSVSGVIGWIGLLIPHFARLLVGPDFARLLPAAMLLGAGYLVAVDTLARTIAPLEIPLGVLTAFIGAPFFIWLLASVAARVAVGHAARRPGSGLRLPGQGSGPRRDLRSGRRARCSAC